MGALADLAARYAAEDAENWIYQERLNMNNGQLLHSEVIKLTSHAIKDNVAEQTHTRGSFKRWMSLIIRRPVSDSQAKDFATNSGIEFVRPKTPGKSRQALSTLIAKMFERYLEARGEAVPESLRLAASGAPNADIEAALEREAKHNSFVWGVAHTDTLKPKREGWLTK